jgi:hypothetical protein
MVSVGGLAVADQARQLPHAPEMGLVADAAFETEPEFGLVDLEAIGNLGWWQEGLDRRKLVRRRWRLFFLRVGRFWQR